MSSVVMCFAEGSSTPTTALPTQSGGGILDSLKIPSDRKRMPARNFLEVYYENGLLSLNSETVQGTFSLEIVSNETRQTYEIPNCNVGDSILLYLNEGEYEVTAMGTDDLIFTGIICIY